MDPQKRVGRVSLCAGCGRQILDRYILRVFPDLEWHAACLKCAACQRYLDESRTCFIKDGKALCKDDYRRLYAIKCAKCLKTFTSHDHIMRAQLNIYHVHCFRCEGCDRQLLPGDEFIFREGYLFCTANDEHSNALMTSSGHATRRTIPEKSAKEPDSRQSSNTQEHWWSGAQSQPERTTRVRTVLSESQLHMLRTCYSANPRPDALVKEQLVHMTGLSPRVIRVWFQNKRCKDKKRIATVRQTQRMTLKQARANARRQTEEKPFSAPSPVSQDGAMPMSPLDFQCWKLLSGFSFHLDGDCMQDQNLVSACHIQEVGLQLSCAAEDGPISTQLPESPSNLASSPAHGSKEC